MFPAPAGCASRNDLPDLRAANGKERLIFPKVCSNAADGSGSFVRPNTTFAGTGRHIVRASQIAVRSAHARHRSASAAPKDGEVISR